MWNAIDGHVREESGKGPGGVVSKIFVGEEFQDSIR